MKHLKIYEAQFKLGLLLLVVLLPVIVIKACKGKERLPGVYVNQLTVIGDDRIDSLYQVNSVYFKMSLGSATASTGDVSYIPSQKISEATILRDTFRVKDLYLVDSLGSKLRFESHDEFLNYMHARGYAVQSETKTSKYTIEYTFKKATE